MVQDDHSAAARGRLAEWPPLSWTAQRGFKAPPNAFNPTGAPQAHVGPRRRTSWWPFKAMVLAQCDTPGMSVAPVAMSHGTEEAPKPSEAKHTSPPPPADPAAEMIKRLAPSTPGHSAQSRTKH